MRAVSLDNSESKLLEMSKNIKKSPLKCGD